MTTRPSMRRPFPAVTPLGRFMVENGITNERLARNANFSIVTIYKLRRGRSEPHLQTMVAMARAAPRSSAGAYAQRSYSTLATTSRRTDTPYTRLTVTLPTFIIVALRDMVAGGKYSVSDLLTGWLLQALSKKDLLNVADNHPEFRSVIEAWLASRRKLAGQ